MTRQALIDVPIINAGCNQNIDKHLVCHIYGLITRDYTINWWTNKMYQRRWQSSGLLCCGCCQYLHNAMFKYSQKFAKKVSRLPSNLRKTWNFFTANKSNIRYGTTFLKGLNVTGHVKINHASTNHILMNTFSSKKSIYFL